MTHDDENTASPSASDLSPVAAKALDWFICHQSGAMTAAEQAAFDAWRAEPAHARAYARIAGLWDSPEFAQALENQTPPAAAHSGLPKGGLRIAMALAAMLILAVGLGHAAGLNPLTPPADHATATGERTEVSLSDGSRLVLNAESAVNLSFGPDGRQVDLVRGEAFFDVVRDPKRPFEVTAGHSVTRVLGTAFSVTLRKGETEVRVQSGHVQVTGDDGSGPVDLTPGQGVTVAAGHPGTAKPLEAKTSFAWLDGRFVFRDRPLAEVMDRLARHHRGKIVLTTKRLRDLRVSGNYRLDDPAAVVASLADVAGAEMVRLPGLLTVLH
jgi:transmembrane sensor